LQEILLSMVVVGAIGGILAVALELADRYIANYGEITIDINDGAREQVVDGGGKLLSALVQDGIFIPSACGGRGSCGYCTVKVDSGGGPVLPIENGWIKPAEIDAGQRLSCQIKLREDIRIHIPDELFLIKEYEGEVTSVVDLTHDIKEVKITLLDPSEIEYQTGQYMQLTVPEYGDVDESVYRAYSMSSCELDKDCVEFLIRYIPEGICTTWVHQYMRAGDNVNLNGPHGDFYLRDTDRPIIMIAGGSGMAPMKGMLAKMAVDRNPRQVRYFFGAASTRDLYYLDLMAEFEKKIPNFKFIPAVGAPPGVKIEDEGEWHGEKGLITEVVDRLTDNAEEAEAYLCGSPGMIDACIAVLKKKGMPEDQIFFDKFT
jgi:Na+-transporting NADH:ubiquinone oxidoreductase subunit F